MPIDRHRTTKVSFLWIHMWLSLYNNLRIILFLVDRYSCSIEHHFLVKNQLFTMILLIIKIWEKQKKRIEVLSCYNSREENNNIRAIIFLINYPLFLRLLFFFCCNFSRSLFFLMHARTHLIRSNFRCYLSENNVDYQTSHFIINV